MPRDKGEMKGQTEFYGVYKGRVESSLDPLKIGRAQVRIPCFHGIVGNGDAIPDEDLPWASYCSPSGAGCDHGSFIPPEKGDYVWVAFEGGDVDKPVILGGSFGIGSSSVKNYGEGDYQWTGSSGFVEVPLESSNEVEPTTKVVYKSPKGTSIIIEEKNNAEELLIVDRIGQCIVMKCPYGNELRRRELRYDKNKGLVPKGEASIELHDSAGQFIKLTSSGSEVGIELHDKDDQVVKLSDNKIKLLSKGCSIVLGDGKIKMDGDVEINGKTSISDNLGVKGSASISGSLSHGGGKCC